MYNFYHKNTINTILNYANLQQIKHYIVYILRINHICVLKHISTFISIEIFVLTLN